MSLPAAWLASTAFSTLLTASVVTNDGGSYDTSDFFSWQSGDIGGSVTHALHTDWDHVHAQGPLGQVDIFSGHQVTTDVSDYFGQDWFSENGHVDAFDWKVIQVSTPAWQGGVNGVSVETTHDVIDFGQFASSGPFGNYFGSWSHEVVDHNTFVEVASPWLAASGRGSEQVVTDSGYSQGSGFSSSYFHQEATADYHVEAHGFGAGAAFLAPPVMEPMPFHTTEHGLLV